MTSQAFYRVSFFNQGKVYEIYGRSVSHGGLPGFVEVEKLVFGERAQVVIDPSEERLQHEFEGVQRTYIPVHAVIRIDQVDRHGPARIREAGESGKVTPFPVFTAGGERN